MSKSTTQESQTTMTSPADRLHSLGGLHDADILNIIHDEATSKIVVEIDNAYANFKGYPADPGRKTMRIHCSGVTWYHQPEISVYPLWISEVYVDNIVGKMRLNLQTTTALTPIIIECTELRLEEEFEYDFTDADD